MLKKLFFAAMLITGTMSFAQEAGAKIEFKKDTHEFGEIDQGESVSVDFEFTNTGNEPLEILDVKTSCGCTSAKPTKSTYQPGEAGVIPVTFNSAKFSNAITKKVTVTTNDTANPKTTLVIKGTVVKEINVSPISLTLFNIGRDEKDLVREITVNTNRLPKLEVSNISSSLDFLTFETSKVDDKKTVIKVKVDTEKMPTGTSMFNGTIKFDTNGEKDKSVVVRTNIRVKDPLSPIPRSVYFFNSKTGQTRSTVVNLSASKGKNFSIKEIKSDLEFVKAEVTEEGEEGKKLTVTLGENAAEGRFSGMITITTDMAEQPEVKIPVRGSVL